MANLSRSAKELAASLGRTTKSVAKYIFNNGITRDKQAIRDMAYRGMVAAGIIGRRGAANPAWKGGISKNNMHWKRLQIARYPDRVAARDAAYQAVRRGEILKQPCPCGNPKAHAHHDDYSKPLEVRWLCRSCHLKEHNGVWNSDPKPRKNTPQ